MTPFFTPGWRRLAFSVTCTEISSITTSVTSGTSKPPPPPSGTMVRYITPLPVRGSGVARGFLGGSVWAAICLYWGRNESSCAVAKMPPCCWLTCSGTGYGHKTPLLQPRWSNSGSNSSSSGSNSSSGGSSCCSSRNQLGSCNSRCSRHSLRSQGSNNRCNRCSCQVMSCSSSSGSNWSMAAPRR